MATLYLPRFLSLLIALFCLANAALLQNPHIARSDAIGSPLSPTGDSSQATGTGSGSGAVTSSPSPSSSPPPSTSAVPTESPTESPTEVSSEISSESSTSSSTSTITPTSTVSTSKPTSKPTSSKSQDAEPAPTSQQSSVQPTKESTSSQQPAKSTVTATVTSTSTDAAESSNNAPKTSSTPDLNSDNNNASSGMPPKTRNTVVGVVVGIGGAILLGALAMVSYRIWGRKKLSEENDGLMSYDMGNTGYEKQEASVPVTNNQQTPFQSTLENYHQPNHVTTSSNF